MKRLLLMGSVAALPAITGCSQFHFCRIGTLCSGIVFWGGTLVLAISFIVGVYILAKFVEGEAGEG